MVPLLGRNPAEFVIFNYILDYIYSKFNQLLSSWNQDILQPNKLALYCSVIHQNGALQQNCFEFVDGTVLRISRPKINRKIVCNGHKRVHDIKFQSLALPNGLICSLSIPYAGKRENGMIVPCYAGLGCSQIYRDQYWQ